MDSESSFMFDATYSHFLNLLLGLKNKLSNTALSPEELQRIQQELLVIRLTITAESQEGHAAFGRDLSALPIAIENARNQILEVKTISPSAVQIQGWEGELLSITQLYESGSIHNPDELRGLYIRLKTLLEEIEVVYVESFRKSGASAINKIIDELRQKPEDWNEREGFINELELLFARLESANTRELIDIIRLEFQKIVLRFEESYHQYEQRKEDEAFLKNFRLFIATFGKDKKAGKNLFNAIFGRTEKEKKESKDAFAFLATSILASGITALGLLVAHPDPALVMQVSLMIEGLLAIGLPIANRLASIVENMENTNPRFLQRSKNLANKISSGRIQSSVGTVLKDMVLYQNLAALWVQPSLVMSMGYGSRAFGLNVRNGQGDSSPLSGSHHVIPGHSPEPHGGQNPFHPNPAPGYESAPQQPVTGHQQTPHYPPQAFGSEPPVGHETVVSSVNGIDWLHTPGDNPWDKVLNHIYSLHPEVQHSMPATNGVKNILVELAKLHDPHTAYQTPEQVMKVLDHYDVDKMIRVFNDLASGDNEKITQLYNKYPQQVINLLQRISTGIGSHGTAGMVPTQAEADLLQKTFAALP